MDADLAGAEIEILLGDRDTRGLLEQDAPARNSEMTPFAPAGTMRAATTDTAIRLLTIIPHPPVERIMRMIARRGNGRATSR